MQLTSVTQKGQVTIPKELREKFNIPVNGKVKLEAGKGFIKIRPIKSNILDLAGHIKAPKGKNALEAREFMEDNYRRA